MPVDGDLDLWRRAARISAEARELGARLVVPGASRRAVAEAIEDLIRSRGAAPAFPANLSRNQEAAHYTPSPDDEARFVEGDLVKVDVGAHLDGRIADTATTVEVGSTHRYDHLIRAVHEAVRAGIS
ncbi:methionine aminopeptidase, type II, partial [mine drainage metagenome]